MSSKGLCSFSTGDHAVQLDLIGKVHGLTAAESYFNNMSEQEKIDKTYGALLNCYVREGLVDKSLSHMQQMKEMGFASSSLSYNDIMCLYTRTGQLEKVPDVLSEMKKNGVSPDNFSYRICINSYGTRSDLNSMEKLLEEMESEPHISMDWTTYSTVANFYVKAGFNKKTLTFLKKLEENVCKDALGYNHLISLYEVMRLWGVQKVTCKKQINRDYITMLGSLVKLEGLIEKAEVMLQDIIKRGKTPIPNSWAILASAYLDKQNMEKALHCMKQALAVQAENPGWTPKPSLISSILDWLGVKGEIEEVEAFVSSLKMKVPMNEEIYHALIKANIRGGKEVDGILESMKADNIDEDSEGKLND
ncbi:hypothetical protein F0562_010313 [Nyssa sinensis]|uniref:Pentacotripeptide-repeat region of PRORP domain-containing protein n=1 Tax=Nyssa sinensis TaxID=561372 RepID=A0A5J5A080_9ASTE|nr:hypothetical protein F0562_010313 [Nyssa sinensis]